MKRLQPFPMISIGILVSTYLSAQSLSCPYVATCTTNGPSLSTTNASATNATALRGKATAVTGNGVGVDGESYAGVDVNAASGGPRTGLVVASYSGNLIKGCGGTCSSNVFRVDNIGNVHATAYFVGGADVAEFVKTLDRPEPGDVVEIDPLHAGFFRKASTPNGTAVAGVISSAPGVTMNSKNSANKTKTGPQLALVGQVPVKVTTTNGSINPGDLLVASGVQGRAMRAGASPAAGTVIGKALGSFEKGDGTVEMLVWSRQPATNLGEDGRRRGRQSCAPRLPLLFLFLPARSQSV